MDQKTTRTLPVKLKDDEVAIRAQELAEATIHAKDTELSAESAAEEWKEEKKRLENLTSSARAEALRLGRIVKQREEPREVTCLVKVENGQYMLVREDTGEVVVQRAASASELQGHLFDEAGKAVDEAVEKAVEGAEDEPEDEPSEPDPDTKGDEIRNGDHPGPEPRSDQ